MADDVKISALAAGTALSGTELVPIVQSGTTVRTTTAAIASLYQLIPAFTLNSITATTATTAVDLSNGLEVVIDWQASTTLNFTNGPPAGERWHVALLMENDATGGYSLTLAQWDGSAITPEEPGGPGSVTVSTGANEVGLLHFVLIGDATPANRRIILLDGGQAIA